MLVFRTLIKLANQVASNSQRVVRKLYRCCTEILPGINFPLIIGIQKVWSKRRSNWNVPCCQRDLWNWYRLCSSSCYMDHLDFSSRNQWFVPRVLTCLIKPRLPSSPRHHFHFSHSSNLKIFYCWSLLAYLRLLHDVPSRYNSPAVCFSSLRAEHLQVRSWAIDRVVDLDLGLKGNALLPPVPLLTENCPV